jgi:branched-chain amino acid transport system substrate-binding protein
LYSEDDGSDTSKSSSEVQDLVQNKKAKVLLGDFNPLSIAGFRAGVDQMKIPALGGDQTTDDYNKDPLLFPIGAGALPQYYGPMITLARQGLTRVGILWCVEASPCTVFHQAYLDKAASAGARIVYDAQDSLTQPDYTSQCQAAKNAGVQQLGVAADSGALQRVARSCSTVGLAVPLVAVSLASTFDQTDRYLRAATIHSAGATVPWFLVDTPAEQEFQRVMKTYARGTTITGSAALAYASGRMLEVAVGKLGAAAQADLTTDMISRGIGQIKSETLGGFTSPTSYSAGQPTPVNNCVSAVVFDTDGSFKAPQGGTFQCA